MDDIQKKIISSRVLAAVGAIERKNAAADVQPTFALLRELRDSLDIPQDSLREVLQELQQHGYIKTGRTINDTYIQTSR